MRFISSSLCLLALLVLAASSQAQVQVNPATQVRWPAVSGTADPVNPAQPCTSANYGQPYTNSASGAQFVCSALGWRNVGGSSSAPGATMDVPFNASGAFVADTGKFIYNATTHLLSSSVNGEINSDLYGGATAVMASSQCASGCAVAVPATTTDSATPVVPATSGISVQSQLNKAYMRAFYNVKSTGPNMVRFATNPNASYYYGCGAHPSVVCDLLLQDTPNPLAADLVTNMPIVHVGSTTVSARYGWNYGAVTGCLGNCWTNISADSVGLLVQESGISHAHSTGMDKYANGDWALSYGYGYSDGGADGGADEGGQGATIETGEEPAYYHGLAGTGASTGTIALPVVTGTSSTINRANTGAGTWMLDISKAFNSGNPVTVVGTPTPIRTTYPSLPASDASPLVVPIDTTVTPSAFIGTISCATVAHPSADLDTVSLLNPQAPKTLTGCTLTQVGGGGTLAPGLAYIAGQLPERASLANVVPLGGGQYTADISYRNPHGATNSTVWQGSNVEGMVASVDRYSLDASDWNTAGHPNAPDPDNPRRLIIPVAGAVDSTHIAVTWAALGQEPIFYAQPRAVTSVVKSGTTITMALDGSNPAAYNQFNRIATATLAGCSDGALNGAVTNVVVSLVTNTITATQAAGGTSCASATLQLNASNFGLHLYPAARTVGPAITVPGTQPLEANNVPWAAGDVIEAPHHPIWQNELQQLTDTVYNATPNKIRTEGMVYNYRGAAVNGAFAAQRITNNNLCSMYVGCGGYVTPAYVMFLGGDIANAGTWAGLARISSAPPNGSAVITMGCKDAAAGGCDGERINWLDLSQVTGGRLAVVPNSGGSGNPEWNLSNLALGNTGGLWATAARQGNLDAGSVFINGYPDQINTIHGPGNGAGKLYFTGNNMGAGTITPITGIGLCNHNLAGANLAKLFVGQCSLTGGPTSYSTDGQLVTNTLEAQGATTLGATTAGSPAPPSIVSAVYSGTAGATTRSYQLQYRTAIGYGELGPTMNVTNTIVVLDASDTVTITCPALPATPGGLTFSVHAAAAGSDGERYVGTCASGGTLVDSGGGTAVSNSPSTTWNANQAVQAGRFTADGQGDFSFSKPNNPTLDTFISRTGVGAVSVGTTHGGANGELHVGVLGATGLSSLASLQVGHIQNGTGLQIAGDTACTFAAGVGNSCTQTINVLQTYPDTTYTPVCSLIDGSGPSAVSVSNRTTATFDVTLTGLTVSSTGAGVVSCIVMH